MDTNIFEAVMKKVIEKYNEVNNTSITYEMLDVQERDRLIKIKENNNGV